MTEMGYAHSSMAPDIDEKAIRHEDPYFMPTLIARAKADALLERVNIPALIITADQVVLAPTPEAGPFPPPSTEAAAEGAGGSAKEVGATRHPLECVEVHEKPSSLEEAEAFIRGYSGSWIQTVSSVTVHNTATGARVDGTDVTTVWFRDIPEEVITAMLQPPPDGSSTEPKLMQCAGAVQVENHLLAPYIIAKSGPDDCIFGLPKALLVKLLVSQGAPDAPVAPEASAEASVALAVAAHEGLE